MDEAVTEARRDRQKAVTARERKRLEERVEVRGEVASAARHYAAASQANSARGAGSALDSLRDAINLAHEEIWFREQPAKGVRILDAAVANPPLRAAPEETRPYFSIAREYALAGRPDRARAILQQYEADVKDTSLKRSQEPGHHAALGEIALAEKRGTDAIKEFRLSDQLPDGPPGASPLLTYAALGRAFDQANMPDSAIVYFERYFAVAQLRRVNEDADYAAGLHKRLGELYEAKNERQKAAWHYLKFIALWKNADPELQPKVAEVRQRLKRLTDVEKK